MHPTELRAKKADKLHKALETNYEFMWRSLVQTVDLLAKGTTYYFTIFGVIGGFLFTAKLSPRLELLLVVVSSVVSILFAVIMISFAYGVLKGVNQMEKALLRIHPVAFQTLAMESFFRRGKRVGVITTACCVLILATVATGLVVKLYA